MYRLYTAGGYNKNNNNYHYRRGIYLFLYLPMVSVLSRQLTFDASVVNEQSHPAMIVLSSGPVRLELKVVWNYSIDP